jgi:hypothetical protein
MSTINSLKSIKALDVSIGSSGDLIPRQQATSIKTLRSADCYLQFFLKFAQLATFHSFAEYLFSAILESDPRVHSFVPQPYLLQVGRRRYTPDIFYIKSGVKYVAELKPRGEFSDSLKRPLTEFFKFHGIEFQVISSESVLQRDLFAQSWIQIIQTLVSAKYEDSRNTELDIYDSLIRKGSMAIGSIVDTGDRIQNRLQEIGLYRLAHSGKVDIKIEDSLIDMDTEVSLCI